MTCIPHAQPAIWPLLSYHKHTSKTALGSPNAVSSEPNAADRDGILDNASMYRFTKR